jgi:2-methylisocitrate lyase-like PEP mutase family enzyme
VYDRAGRLAEASRFAVGMSGQADRAERFLALHSGEGLLLLPNPWDPGSAKLLASLGFEALATTSGGSAATLGRLDGSMSAEEAIASAAAIVEATELPVSADLENGFADDPEGVAETLRLALDAGLAGASIEDYSGHEDAPIYGIELAAERVAAAAEIAHGGRSRLVLTARAENHLRGVTDLADTIARLQAYQEAGADVLYAPGPRKRDDIQAIVTAAGPKPVNVLMGSNIGLTVSDLAGLGVRRISVGSALSRAAWTGFIRAAKLMAEEGSFAGFDGSVAFAELNGFFREDLKERSR